MSKTSLLFGLGVIVVIALWLVGAYNSFIRLGEDVNTQLSQVESQYQRRYDLIPNLVETVKGFASHETELFQGVAEARARVGQIKMTPELLKDPEAFNQFQQAQGELSTFLGRLMAVSESYPELKSDQNFLALQKQLEGTENRIATERMRYNELVKKYNIKAKGIPGRWLVGLFGLDPEKPLFKADQGAEKAPEVKF